MTKAPMPDELCLHSWAFDSSMVELFYRDREAATSAREAIAQVARRRLGHPDPWVGLFWQEGKTSGEVVYVVRLMGEQWLPEAVRKHFSDEIATINKAEVEQNLQQMKAAYHQWRGRPLSLTPAQQSGIFKLQGAVVQEAVQEVLGEVFPSLTLAQQTARCDGELMRLAHGHGNLKRLYPPM